MPSVVVDECTKDNADVYLGLLEGHVVPLMRNLANGRDYVLRQDKFKLGFLQMF